MKHLMAIVIFGLSTLFSFAQTNELALQSSSIVSYTMAEEEGPITVIAQNAAREISAYVAKNMEYTEDFDFLSSAKILTAVEISEEGNIKKIEIIKGTTNVLDQALIKTIRSFNQNDELASSQDYTVIIPFLFTNS